ncbi:hypothetical protein [Erwinia tasmaniensis]
MKRTRKAMCWLLSAVILTGAVACPVLKRRVGAKSYGPGSASGKTVPN